MNRSREAFPWQGEGAEAEELGDMERALLRHYRLTWYMLMSLASVIAFLFLISDL